MSDSGGKVRKTGMADRSGRQKGQSLNKENQAVDPEVLACMFSDEEEITQILGDFLKAAKANLNEMAMGIREKSFARVQSASHKLKSSSLSVGAMELGDFCREMEQASRDGKSWEAIEKQEYRMVALLKAVEDYVLGLDRQ